MRPDLNDISEKYIESFVNEYTLNGDQRSLEKFKLSIDILENNIEAITRIKLESLGYSENDIVTVTRFVGVNVRLLLSSKYIFLTGKQV